MNNNTVSSSSLVVCNVPGGFVVTSPIGEVKVTVSTRDGKVKAYLTVEKATVRGRPCHGYGDATLWEGGRWSIGCTLYRDDPDAYGRPRFMAEATDGQKAAVRAVVEAALPMIWRDHRAEIERADVESDRARKEARIAECREEIAKLEKEILALG